MVPRNAEDRENPFMALTPVKPSSAMTNHHTKHPTKNYSVPPTEASGFKSLTFQTPKMRSLRSLSS